MSSHLQWMVLRNNSAFLIKGAKCHSFSTEANNLKGVNSFRYNGLVHEKTIGVNLSTDKKSIVMQTKKQTCKNKPAKSQSKTTLKIASGPRRVLSQIRTSIRKTRYRKDLKMLALRRASALMSGQKTRPVAASVDSKKTVA
jgi:large subunit ribosomal protein L28e